MKQNKPLYLDPKKSVEDRVEDLISRMTLDEKIAQLQARQGFELLNPSGLDKQKLNNLLKHGIGHIARIAGILVLPPIYSALITNSIQHYLKKFTRLGIPAIIHEECLAGLQAKDATTFPQIIGLSSTWEPSLATKMTEVIRTQMRAIGTQQGLSPVLDVARDPRWGRTEETYGEDPYLVSCMGTAYVRGLQGDDLGTGVIATAKHFLGYSASEGGLNWAPPHINYKELYEVFARPFAAAIKEADLQSIMHAYNEIEGVPCAISPKILTELLRENLGFQGFVVSDYNGISTTFSYHHAALSMEDAAIQALNAGLDMELPTVEAYGDVLKSAVLSGKIKEETVDKSVRRILKIKFELGLFEQPYIRPRKIKSLYSLAGNSDLSLEIARKSIVLLKNTGNILPLSKSISSIAVIGPNAHSLRNLFGDYSYLGQLEGMLDFAMNYSQSTQLGEKEKAWLGKVYKDILADKENELFTKKIYGSQTIYEAIKDKASNKKNVRYIRGCNILSAETEGINEAVALAKASEVVVLVVGDRSGLRIDCTSGETRDRADLNLPGSQEKLVREIVATGKPVVLVLINGRPLSIKWAAAHVHAIVEAWLPGERGGRAVADVLFGDVTPGGKLPISFPRSVGQIPVYYYHKPSGGRSNWFGDYVEEEVKPLYEFGFGLSYTTFSYSNLLISPPAVDSGGEVKISFTLTNSGQKAGDEVAQLYVHDREAMVTRPVKELAGFARVHLQPNETCAVSFTLKISQLGFLDRNNAFVVESGNIDVLIGSSSEDIRLRGEFAIAGKTLDITKTRSFFADVKVIRR